jgi:hypothetical protein
MSVDDGEHVKSRKMNKGAYRRRCGTGQGVADRVMSVSECRCVKNSDVVVIKDKGAPILVPVK